MMTEKAIIISCKEKIIACRLAKSECISCTAGCARKKDMFEVDNPLNLSIKDGNIISIAASKKNQAIQGIFSLLIPFACAVSGYFLAPFIAGLFGKTISSDGKAGFVLLFLFLSSAAVFAITRKFPLPGKPEILEVL